MSSASTSNEVAAATREVLENSNLEEINERKLRQLVRERTGADTSLPDLKALIHSVVEEFLEQDRDSEKQQDEPDAHRASKTGKAKKRKAGESEDDEAQDEEDDDEPVSRGGKGASSKQPTKKFPVGDSGEIIVCKLSGKRRLTVGEYKGTLFVSIREFYEKDGQERPGKGVSLPIEQWNTLTKHVQDVEAAIKQAQR